MVKVVEVDADAFLLESFLTKEECSLLITRTENIGYSDAMIVSDGKQIAAREIRNNKRVIIDDENLAAEIWSKVRVYVPETLEGCKAIGLNERFRFYRYEPKQMFRLHKDFPHKREGQESKLSIIIYLNDDFKGGETDFRKFKITPKAGSAFVFRHELLHEGCAVKSGKKYAVRTDIMYETSI